MRLLLFILLFFFVFGWKVTDYLDLIPMVSILLCILGLILGFRSIPRQAVEIIGWLMMLVTYTAFIVVINGAVELDVFMRSARALVNFAGGVALVRLYIRFYGERFSKVIIYDLFLVLVVHGGLMLAMYLDDNLRQMVYAVTNAYHYVNLNYPFLSGLRVTGLTYGLSQTSVVQMFGLLLLPTVLTSEEQKPHKLVVCIIGIVIIVSSMFISGRSGMILGIVFVLYVWWLKRQRTTRKPGCRASMIVKEQFYLLGVGIMGIVLGFMVVWHLLPEKTYLIARASEVIDFFIKPFETPTTETLRFIYPDSPWVFLFGNSGMGRGPLGYIPSDIGYVRMLFALGVLGSLIMLVPYWIGLKLALRCPDRLIRTSTVAIIIATLILHFKEVALLTRNQWSIYSILVACCIMLINQQNLSSFTPVLSRQIPCAKQCSGK